MIHKFRELYSNQTSEVKGLAKDIFWSVFGSVSSKVLNFIAWILIVRILGKDGYGEYGLIRNTVMMFSAFASFGLGITGTKFIAQYLESDSSKASRIASLTMSFAAFMGIIVTIASFTFSDLIADKTLKSPYLVNDFRIASFILLMSALNGAQTGILFGLKQFKTDAKINIINALISFPVFVTGAYFYGVRGSIIAYTITNFTLCVQYQMAIKSLVQRKVISLNLREGLKEWRLLYIFSLPAALSGLIIMPVKWCSDVMLVNTAGFSAMGIYSAALIVNTIVVVAANTLNAPFIAFMSNSKTHDNLIEKLNVLMPWFLGVMIGLPFLCFPEIGSYLFGKEYEGEIFDRTLVFVILFMVIIMYKQGMSRIFVTQNMQWVNLLDNVLWGVFLLSSFYYLKCYASVGLAISYCLAYIMVTMVMYPVYIKKRWMPLEFVVSKNVLIVWSMISALIGLSFISVSWIIRIPIYLLGCFVVILTFKSMLNSNIKYNILEKHSSQVKQAE